MKLRNKNTKEVGLLRNIAFSLLGDVATIQLIIEIDGFNISYYYHTLDEVYAEWEDYTPQEPQIKDSRVRKIVRDWYKYLDTDLPLYYEDACTLSIDHSARIEFFDRVFSNLERDHKYTITELCGEEE